MTYFFICLCEGSEATKQTPGRDKKIRHSERSEESHRRTDGYIFLALVVGYFANAQYDVLFIPYRHFVPLPRGRKQDLFVYLCEGSEATKQTPGRDKKYVILSMSSEQTCLQGFVSEDIHKAQAFCKNAKR